MNAPGYLRHPTLNRDTIVFAIIVAVLFAKPAGFLGVIRKERV